MIILGLIGFLFFGAIGYFAYTFAQCLCVFSRLDKIINKKIVGVLSVAVYFYYVYINQDAIVEAFMKPINNLAAIS
ncbi:MAG: hypothetical protein HOG46_04065 [Gammaproteobacteria bacterium]|nr:hypothetical protein [Gammaproteobacteria bacterium]MBT5406677.1 hypothetical protein [Gammaproteobacteria bacterium]MBT6733683.1 hypothetical protein [Gammaproteobacteria bacterium]